MSAARIATVTLNPSLDEAIGVQELVLGATNRCSLDALDPGGKGINASRVIYRLGRETVALGFVAGFTGAMLQESLRKEGLSHRFDPIPGLTRVNVMVYERGSGRRCRLYLPGPHVDSESLAALKTRLDDLEENSIAVLGGSVPPGLPETIYHDLVGYLAAKNVRAVVDTSGAALKHAVAARPLLVKPNVEEAEELVGRRLAGDRAVFEAADEIRRRGPHYVVISQGADGAIGVGPGEAWKAIPPSIDARSTVGSGDSMVAGLAIAFNEAKGFRYGLRLGTAAGAATATTPGTQLCERAQVQELLHGVVVHSLAAEAERVSV